MNNLFHSGRDFILRLHEKEAIKAKNQNFGIDRLEAQLHYCSY